MARSARAIASAASLFVAVTILTAEPASALILQSGSPLQHQFNDELANVVVRRGGAGARPGGGARWVRPAHYYWRPGGAIAAGAAIGVLATGAAIAYAGQPPAPGLCWYYTDPSYRQGFWDACQ